MGRLVCAGAGVFVLGAAMAGAAGAQLETAEEGRVHVSLVLDTQSIELAYPPALSAADAAHEALLTGAIGARAPVGMLTADAALRIGSIAYDPAAPPGNPSYQLSLMRAGGGWELEAHNGAAQTVPLAHRAASVPAPTLQASLHATGARSGRLYLRWGPHIWSTEFRFDEIPPVEVQFPGGGGFGEALERDSDTSATARENQLAERNETALVLPGGERIAILYGQNLPVDGVDYPNLTSTADGAVVELIRAPALRLRSDVALRVGQTAVPTGNLAAGFAGSYGLWLKRAGGGWRFVFNNEPDSWGTQHDPAFDAAETAADYSRGAGAFRPLGVTLVPTGAHAGRMLVHWGPHEWAADFTVTP